MHRFALIAGNGVALTWFLFQCMIAVRPGLIGTIQQRAIHLGFALTLFFLLAAWKAKRPLLARVDIALAVLSAGVQTFAFFEVHKQQFLQGLYSPEALVIAVVGLLVVSLAAYRSLGLALPLIGGLLMLWVTVGSHLPGLLRIPSVAVSRVLAGTYYSADGVHGVPLDASTRYIFMFIVFGAFLVEFGATSYLLQLVQRLFRNSRGGAGKMSVVGSLFFGVVSDSTTANVATTGVIMIPSMTRTGFSSEEAAAVESASSVAGQLTPPVMGTVAFIMVAITGIPYPQIALAAVVPALLYYLSLFMSVDRVAARRGLGAADLDLVRNTRREWLMGGITYGIPLVVMLHLLVIERWEPSEAVTWALILLIGLYLARFPRVESLRRCGIAVIKGARRAVIVSIVTAVVGLMIAPIFTSGLGLRLTSIFLDLAGDNVWVLLVMTMLASFILGSGLPSSATYVLLAILVAPSLIEFGLPILAVHMFIMYHGVLSDISPPTMATVFVASGIAKSRPFATGFKAMSYAIAGFVVPFLFASHPGTLLQGESVLRTITDIGFAVVVVLALGAATDGWAVRKLGLIERALLLLGAGLMLAPGSVVTTTGLVLSIGTFVVHAILARAAPALGSANSVAPKEREAT